MDWAGDFIPGGISTGPQIPPETVETYFKILWVKNMFGEGGTSYSQLTLAPGVQLVPIQT